MLNSRTIIARAAAASALLVGTGIAEPVAAQIPDVPGWQLAWHDEFDGDSVDVQNWQLLDRQNSFNNEKQYYRPEQASIVDGNLRITATNQPLAGKPYRSARLESWQAFGPGRFEARIKLPTGQGMWPAFWLFPNDPQVPWPTGGEIDVLENRGSQPTIVSSAYHWQTNPGPCCDQHQFVVREYRLRNEDGDWVSFHDDFHVYAAEWDETQIRFYVNGVLHFTVQETANRPIFDTPKNIILNLAVGGDFGGDPDGTTVFPQFIDVDYVRVWQRQTGLSGDFNGDGRVDAADFVVWRKSLGQSGIGLAADASGNGSIGPEDYDHWRAAFGSSDLPVAASMATHAVPEPATAVPMAISFMFAYVQRLRCAAASNARARQSPIDGPSRLRRP